MIIICTAADKLSGEGIRRHIFGVQRLDFFFFFQHIIDHGVLFGGDRVQQRNHDGLGHPEFYCQGGVEHQIGILLIGGDIQLFAPADVGPHFQGKGRVAAPELVVPDDPAAQPQPGMVKHGAAVLVPQGAAGGDIQLEGVGVLTHDDVVQGVDALKNSQFIRAQVQRLGPDDLAIFEGIHALNDIIVGKNPHAFRLYIAARSNLVDDDGNIVFQHAWLRLCRRLVRDYQFRGCDAGFTLKLWDNVCRGEKLYISPYKENAHVMFDSSLAFEFAVLKPMVVPLLEAIPAGKYAVVDDMLRGFEKIEAMDEKYVAPDSLAREFLGGSTDDNH